MEKNITKEQVSELYALCTKNEIYDYDVQIEVVDHLASAIENQWQTNPNLSFSEALNNIPQKFGRNGLQKLERKLTKQMKRNFNQILFRYILEFFKLPKILFTIVLALGLFIALQLANNDLWVIFPYSLIFFAASLIYYYKIFPQKFHIQTADKSFMIITYLKNINTRAGSVAQLPFMVLLFSESLKLKYIHSTGIELFISIPMALLVVVMYAYFVVLPIRIKNYFESNYLQLSES